MEQEPATEKSIDEQIVKLLESIDWKLWELLKVVKPEIEN